MRDIHTELTKQLTDLAAGARAPKHSTAWSGSLRLPLVGIVARGAAATNSQDEDDMPQSKPSRKRTTSGASGLSRASRARARRQRRTARAAHLSRCAAPR